MDSLVTLVVEYKYIPKKQCYKFSKITEKNVNVSYSMNDLEKIMAEGTVQEREFYKFIEYVYLYTNGQYKYNSFVYGKINNISHYNNEYSYLMLLKRILAEGSERTDRTNVGTYSLFGQQLVFDIKEYIPILTTKYVYWDKCIIELVWFLSGKTDSNDLTKQGVNIWSLNTTREFLNSRNLYHLKEGDIGAGYGFQWRHFGAEYKTCEDDYDDQGIDQIKQVIESIKTDPYSRRHVITSWNPPDLNKMALPPCHCLMQFYVDGNNLSCHMYQRSADCFLGLPFNILSYTILTYLIGLETGLKPHKLIISIGDAHIYKTHIECVKRQLELPLYPPPKIEITKQSSIFNYSLADFKLIGYLHNPSIGASMSI